MKLFSLISAAFAVALWMAASNLPAQQLPPIDTTLDNTQTASKAAAWLKDLTLPTGKGGVGALSSFSAQAIISDTSRRYADKNGMTAYYASSLYPADLRDIRTRTLQRLTLMRRLGVIAARDPALFGWGVLEPAKGNYNFTLVDSIVKIGGVSGVPFVGTIVPFADWASACNTDQTASCGNLFGSQTGADYFFINQGKTGPVCDTAALYAFVQKIVERYDGDGVDDMPGLVLPIRYWEFSNEPDGMCGGYGNDRQQYPSLYARDHSITYRAVKAACPSCQVLNGGAIEFREPSFWNAVFDTLAPKLRHIDIANVHDNNGKTTSPVEWAWDNNFYGFVSGLQAKISQYGLSIPIWMTEWGFYSGSPTLKEGNVTRTLPYRSEEEYTAIHIKFYAWGKANNLTTFFYDFSGGPGGWGAALVQIDPLGAMSNKAMLLYHTLKLYEYKFRDADSARQISFSTSGNLSLPSGHIRFYKKGVATDVVWGLSSLPADITGRKAVTDMYGNADTLNASAIKTPLSSNPVIIENAVTTDVRQTRAPADFRVFPNPANGVVTIAGECETGESLRVELANLLGETVMTADYGAASGAFSRDISVRNLPQGAYVIRLRTSSLSRAELLRIMR